MSNSLLVQFRSLAFNDNTTRYLAPGGAGISSVSVTGEIEIPVRDAGTFSNGYAYALSNTLSNASTITLQKSQVDTALGITFDAAQTGIKENTSDTVAFAATDEVQWEITCPTEGGTHTLTLNLAGCQFAPDTSSNCISFLTVNGSTSLTNASTTLYTTANGGAAQTAGATTTKYRARFAFTSSDLSTYVTANARTTDVVYATRKNGSTGGQSVTYTSGQTGRKEDTSGSDSLAIGDDFDYQITTLAGTESMTWRVISSTCTNTGGIFPLIAGQSGGSAVSAATTNYYPVAGGLLTTTEANCQIYPRFTFTASELGVFSTGNASGSGDCVVTLRDNGAGSGISVTYTPGQTGLKNDSVNTSEITSGTDETNYEVANAGNGTFTATWIGVLGATTAPAGRASKNTRDHAMNYMLHHSEGFGRRIGGAKL